jgi:hypothetical protein
MMLLPAMVQPPKTTAKAAEIPAAGSDQLAASAANVAAEVKLLFAVMVRPLVGLMTACPVV